MLKALRSIHSRDQFLQLTSFDIHAFNQEYFKQQDHLTTFQDHLSKVNDVLFPVNEQLAMRVLSQIEVPYLLSTTSDFKLLEGSCSLEAFEYSEKLTRLNWLKEISTTSLGKKSFKAGETMEVEAKENGFYLLRPESTCVLAHWNYQEKSNTQLIGKFKFAFYNLSDQGRKLIKLSKNIYSNDQRRSPELLTADFHSILEMISEKDLFLIYLTKSFLLTKPQSEDFHRYYEKRVGILT